MSIINYYAIFKFFKNVHTKVCDRWYELCFQCSMWAIKFSSYLFYVYSAYCYTIYIENLLGFYDNS